ncbi:CGNR zinc finger domain-containing protein [Leptolyngbya sp. FACHB-261]|nr:CGNR zinc finger domain-containing protein [Leptolyngbya sp. FACHB-261]
MSQRPLTGEPLALDLLNTEWLESGLRQDLLSTAVGTTAWLEEHSLQQDELVETVRLRLIETRAAIRKVLESPSDIAARNALNVVLAQGRVLEQLGKDGPETIPEVPSSWRVAWLAAQNLLGLLRTAPGRIRTCDHPDCILYFFDTSKNGTRRWCDMKTCGNRSKAKRHYQQHSNKPLPE